MKALYGLGMSSVDNTLLYHSEQSPSEIVVSDNITHVLFVGSWSSANIDAASAQFSGLSLAVIVPLLPKEPSRSRAVWSGILSEEMALCISQREGIIALGEDVQHASRYAVLENGLFAVQTALAAEAISLGLATGLDRWILYHAIAGAAGGSWAFRIIGREILTGVPREDSFIPPFKDTQLFLDQALDLAAVAVFPAPLHAISCQLFQFADRSANPLESCSQIQNLWRDNSLIACSPAGFVAPMGSRILPVKPDKVGFVGLGAMGCGMSHVLRSSGHNVVAYDTWKPSLDRYRQDGGEAASSLVECAQDCDVLVLMVVNAAQATEVLFRDGAAKALPLSAAVLLMSTISPSQAQDLCKSLAKIRPDLLFVECPVSGGTIRAATGDLAIFASGIDDQSLSSSKAVSVMLDLSRQKGNEENLMFIPGGAGKGSAVKLVNQHLAGSHISSTMEALAFAGRLKLPLRETRELLLSGPASSWMMGHRGKNMLDGLLQPPTSSITIFVKDMGIVNQAGRSLKSALPLASLVEQQFIMGVACGWGADDDSSLVRLWREAGIDITVQ